MNHSDMTALHEAMEQQTISVTKAGISTVLKCKTTIVAAANPDRGSFVSGATFREQVNLPSSILSRFDLTFRVLEVRYVRNSVPPCPPRPRLRYFCESRQRQDISI